MEGLGQLYLAAGRLEECERASMHSTRFEQTPGFTPSWRFGRVLLQDFVFSFVSQDGTKLRLSQTLPFGKLAQCMTPTFLGVALFLKALAHHKGGSKRLAAIAVFDAVKIGRSR